MGRGDALAVSVVGHPSSRDALHPIVQWAGLGVTNKADIVICGAGIAGIAAAYHLAARHGLRNITLIDERDPMTLTSDKGTQAYRNWWPGPDDTMLRFISRSIDIVEEMAEESGNQFRLSRRGYLFVTGQDEGVEKLRSTASRFPVRHGSHSERIRVLTRTLRSGGRLSRASHWR